LRISTLSGLAATVSLLALGTGVAQAQDRPGAGVSVQPIMTTVAEELFQHMVLFRGLEELGYEIQQPLELGEYGTLHVAIAQGDADFTAVHWDKLHTAFFENSGGEEVLVKLGALIENVLQGYLIDRATADEYGITNLEQFQDPEIAALFDSNADGTADLTGCNPGWGCERVIEHHLPEYGLAETVTHNQGSYFALIADTVGRFDAGEPIFYYTWTPLWVSGVLVPGEDVVWLEVPYTSLPEGDATAEDTSANGQNLGFAVDDIMVLASREFTEANPAAAAFLEAASIPINDISEQNLSMRDGEDRMRDIERHVETWIEDNRDAFDSWLEAGRAAAG
jgi:glycine betaine/proline transport system substrate-binding protein